MNISIATKQAYSEIDEFLSLLTEEQRNKIPSKLREFLKNSKDKYYTKNIDINVPIKEQNLKEETLAIIAFLNLKYWCEDEKEKLRLETIYAKNDEEILKKVKENINETNVENKNEVNNSIESKENMLIIPEKENFMKRLINRIIKLFKHN